MSDGPTIYPTHSCFDDALELLCAAIFDLPADRYGDGDDVEALALVHAICVVPDGPHAGERYAHAWIEHDGAAWSVGIFDGERVAYPVPVAMHYKGRGVEDVTRYSARQALEENLRSGHYGPWKAEYRALCGRGDRRIYGAIDYGEAEP